jgi:serine/threonine-protein kinase
VIADRYRLQRRLGAGGMGEVYAARHTEIPRLFAVKLMRTEFAQDPTMVARFRQEAHAAAGLVCENVVEIADFGYAREGFPFLVMELLEGTDLRRLLRRGPALSISQAVQLVMQACLGVQAAHEHAIVHRDLKPENLFLTRRGERTLLKVLDFGIAKLRNRPFGTGPGRIIGTPQYMAPEQLRGSAGVDHRVDVYALGAIAYELLTGEVAHPGTGHHEIITHVLFERPRSIRALNPAVPPALASVVERACASAPDARFQSADEFRIALLPFVGADALPIPVLAPAESLHDTLPAHGTDSVQHASAASSSAGSNAAPLGATASGRLTWARSARARPWLLGGAGLLVLAASLRVLAPGALARPSQRVTSLRAARHNPDVALGSEPVKGGASELLADAPSCTASELESLPGQTPPEKPATSPPLAAGIDVARRAHRSGSPLTTAAASGSPAKRPPSKAALFEVQKGDETILFQTENPLRR